MIDGIAKSISIPFINFLTIILNPERINVVLFSISVEQGSRVVAAEVAGE